ncbi:hypothetical protein ACHAW5_001786 [Stephanodiscus triporus]|uniref:Uncharacterized protein n=1 Tax=Stephanodiscus triporus TaxID=2934178 RepID=A0ABD3NPK0_9STRA
MLDEMSEAGRFDALVVKDDTQTSDGEGTAFKMSHEVSEAGRFDALVVKGDAQKSDGAMIPDHLWLHAFLQGYGLQRVLEEHLQALALPTGAAAGHL